MISLELGAGHPFRIRVQYLKVNPKKKKKVMFYGERLRQGHNTFCFCFKIYFLMDHVHSISQSQKPHFQDFGFFVLSGSVHLQ